MELFRVAQTCFVWCKISSGAENTLQKAEEPHPTVMRLFYAPNSLHESDFGGVRRSVRAAA